MLDILSSGSKEQKVGLAVFGGVVPICAPYVEPEGDWVVDEWRQNCVQLPDDILEVLADDDNPDVRYYLRHGRQKLPDYVKNKLLQHR
jgi:hypothetical protein